MSTSLQVFLLFSGVYAVIWLATLAFFTVRDRRRSKLLPLPRSAKLESKAASLILGVIYLLLLAFIAFASALERPPTHELIFFLVIIIGCVVGIYWFLRRWISVKAALILEQQGENRA